jgi:hypothetical protein
MASGPIALDSSQTSMLLNASAPTTAQLTFCSVEWMFSNRYKFWDKTRA